MNKERGNYMKENIGLYIAIIAYFALCGALMYISGQVIPVIIGMVIGFIVPLIMNRGIDNMALALRTLLDFIQLLLGWVVMFAIISVSLKAFLYLINLIQSSLSAEKSEPLELQEEVDNIEKMLENYLENEHRIELGDAIQMSEDTLYIELDTEERDVKIRTPFDRARFLALHEAEQKRFALEIVHKHAYWNGLEQRWMYKKGSFN